MASRTVRDYFRAVQVPDLAFAVPELQTARFAWDELGPALATGRSAVVFQAEVAGRRQAVRCYIRSDASSRERYTALAVYLARQDLNPYVSAVTWLDSAIRVNDATWPVLLMDWIDGRKLDQYVDFLLKGSDTYRPRRARAAVAPACPHAAAGRVFAHGGLQHSDVMVDQEGQLRLVDYDPSGSHRCRTLCRPTNSVTRTTSTRTAGSGDAGWTPFLRWSSIFRW